MKTACPSEPVPEPAYDHSPGTRAIQRMVAAWKVAQTPMSSSGCPYVRNSLSFGAEAAGTEAGHALNSSRADWGHTGLGLPRWRGG